MIRSSRSIWLAAPSGQAQHWRHGGASPRSDAGSVGLGRPPSATDPTRCSALRVGRWRRPFPGFFELDFDDWRWLTGIRRFIGQLINNNFWRIRLLVRFF